jgi:hypothetical protein
MFDKLEVCMCVPKVEVAGASSRFINLRTITHAFIVEVGP